MPNNQPKTKRKSQQTTTVIDKKKDASISKKIVDHLSSVSQEEPEPISDQPQIPVSLPATPPEALMNRQQMHDRANNWAAELTTTGHLKNDQELLVPKEVYCSTSIGDFTKVATWAQWYGVQLFSDLANIDRKRFALLAIEQYFEGYLYCYGLLHRDTGRIRHLFNLKADQVGPRMKKQGLSIPAWLDLADLDHYRLG